MIDTAYLGRLTCSAVITALFGVSAHAQTAPNQAVFGVSHSSRYGSTVDASLEISDVAQTGIAVELDWKRGASGQQYAFEALRFFDVSSTQIGTNAGITVEVYTGKTEWDDDTYDYRTSGLDLTFAADLAAQTRYAVGAFAREDELSEFSAGTSALITDDAGESRAAGFFGRVSWDTYTDGAAIDLGSRVGASARVSVLDQGRRFSKLSFDAQTTQPLAGSVFYDLNFSVGQVSGVGGDAVQVIDRAFSPSNPIRGFKYGGYTPRDPATGDALGGQKYMSASAEAFMPVGDRGLLVGAFVDTGAIWDLSDLDAPNVDDGFVARSSVGLSMRLAVKNAELALSWAKPIVYKDDDEFQNIAVTLGAKF